jgi:predicted alpha/beta-hydrolase family hydrolase
VSARLPLVVGGRSTGARVACRTVEAAGASGVLLLAFPLVPPAARRDPATAAKARALRRTELTAPSRLGLSTTVVQGESDRFGSPAQLRRALRGASHVEVVPVPGADHALRVRARGEDPAPVVLAAALRAVAHARGE